MPNLIERLDALSEALDKATPGPWDTCYRGNYMFDPESDVVDADGEDVTGAEFVSPMRDMPTTRGQMYEQDSLAIVLSVNFLREHIDTLREALRGEGRYRWLRDNAAPDLLNVLVSEWDFFRDAGEQLDAAIDQERGDRMGRDGGDE